MDNQVIQEVALETEQAPVAQTTEKLPPDTAQQATMFINKHLGYIVDSIKNYRGSAKQLKRVMMQLAIYPMQGEPPKFSYAEEGELFNNMRALQDAKLLLLNAATEEQRVAEEIKAKAALQTDVAPVASVNSPVKKTKKNKENK